MAIKPPEPDWVPLLNALFLVGSSDPGAPRGTLEGLARRVRYGIRGEPYQVEVRTEFVVVVLGKVELCVHLPLGFALTKTLDGREPSREDDYIAFGRELNSFLQHVQETAHRGLGATDIEIVERLSSKIWAELHRILDQALELGQWRIVARTDNPLAESFDFIPWDIWRHFRVSEWETGIARAINGARLYSIHVARRQKDPEVKRYQPAQTVPLRDIALEALRRLSDEGLDFQKLTQKALVTRVQIWCRNHGVQIPGRDTILRAAGRRKK